MRPMVGLCQHQSTSYLLRISITRIFYAGVVIFTLFESQVWSSCALLALLYT